jgi:hypothetical protein
MLPGGAAQRIAPTALNKVLQDAFMYGNVTRGR